MSRKTRISGYILVETLIALSITGVALTLFWQARLFQIDVDAKLLQDFAEQRLLRDASALHSLNMLPELNLDGYAPIQITNVTAHSFNMSIGGKASENITFVGSQ